MSWTPWSILTEAYRNVLSDKWRSVPHVAGWSVIVAAIVGIELTTMFALQNVASHREADGMNVVVSTADSGIMAIDCSALDRQHYVRRAGGVRNSRIISLDDLGGVDFVSATVTDRALQVLDPTLSMAQIGSTDGTAFLGSVLADELGLRPGETFAMHGKKVTVAGVLRSSVRAEAFDRWLLTTGPPTGMVDECWVEYDPGVRRISLGISSHVLSRGVADLESHELIRLDERSRSLTQEFREREIVRGWPAIAAIGILLSLGSLWSRRSELALYRTVGLTPSKIFFMIQIEMTLILCAGAVIGATVAAGVMPLLSVEFVAPYSFEHVKIVFRTLALVVSSASVTLPFGALMMGRDTMSLLKDR